MNAPLLLLKAITIRINIKLLTYERYNTLGVGIVASQLNDDGNANCTWSMIG